MEQYLAYIEQNKDRFVEEYFNLLRIPSVAAQNMGISETAMMVRDRLIELGAEHVQVIPTDGGSPVVYGTIGNGPRRLLIYDHYDVQPAEPLDLWDNYPFDPKLCDGVVKARGASDNKGNLMLRLQAIEAWLATKGELPITIVFLIEGEEEIGSPHLASFCRDHADLIKADGCLWETGQVDGSGRPVVDCGAKGMQYVELVARGASTDLHSSTAPVVPNPAWRLTWALATLKDPNDRIRIPGFYDAVLPPTEADMEALRQAPDNDESLLRQYGLPAFLNNVRGADRLRALLFEPTCTICGLVSGYTGEGAKTVLPAEARAKIDFRLVPNMEPETVLTQLRDHLDAEGYHDIEIVPMSGEHPARSSLDAAVVRAAISSAEATYQLPASVYPMMAGTGPMYVVCQQFGTPVTSGAGCGYEGDRIHAPNENIRIADYWKGMEWMGRFMEAFAALE